MLWKEFIEKAKEAGVTDDMEIVEIEMFNDSPSFYIEDKRVWISEW